MSFLLKPARVGVRPLVVGSGCWLWMLDAGVGLPAADGPCLRGARPLVHGQGAQVDAVQAEQMGLAAGWVLAHQQAVQAEWARTAGPERDRLASRRRRGPLARPQESPVPARPDYLERLGLFATWAPGTGGFGVY